jgi:hypothetical protein
MRAVTNLNIGTKLIGSFTVISLLTIIALLIIRQVNLEAINEYDDLAEYYNAAYISVLDLYNDQHQSVNMIHTLATLQSPSERQQLASRAEEHLEHMQEQLNTTRHFIYKDSLNDNDNMVHTVAGEEKRRDEQLQAQYSHFEKAYKAWSEEISRINEMAAAGQVKLAVAELIGPFKPTEHQMNTERDEMLALQRKAADIISSNADALWQTSSNVFYTVLVLNLLVALILGIASTKADFGNCQH